jgi:hypothetical protein
MVNQGQNHIDSPANMLQQQASYEVSATLCLRALISGKSERKKNFIESSAVNKFVAHNFFASQRPEKKGEKFFFSDRRRITLRTFATHTGGLGRDEEVWCGWLVRKLIVITGIYVVRHLHSHWGE